MDIYGRDCLVGEGADASRGITKDGSPLNCGLRQPAAKATRRKIDARLPPLVVSSPRSEGDRTPSANGVPDIPASPLPRERRPIRVRRPPLPIVAGRSRSVRSRLATGPHGVVLRNLWSSRTLTEVPPHLRGGELRAAVPTAEHARTSWPSSPIGFAEQLPHRFLNRGPPRTICEMPPHLAVGEPGAAAPSARHPRPRRAPNESVRP